MTAAEEGKTSDKADEWLHSRERMSRYRYKYLTSDQGRHSLFASVTRVVWYEGCAEGLEGGLSNAWLERANGGAVNNFN